MDEGSGMDVGEAFFSFASGQGSHEKNIRAKVLTLFD